MSRVLRYTTNTDDIFESLIKEDFFEYNHVVIKPNFFFPTHPTDANVIITVVNGELSLTIGDGEEVIYKKGSVIQTEVGLMTTLGNRKSEPTEVFVIKRR